MSDPDPVLDGPWDYGAFTLTCSTDPRPDLTDQLWPLYLETFGPLATRAAARHVLTREEFAAELEDERVWRYLAVDADGAPVGLTTLTNDLATMPWISPDFFAFHFPDEWSRGAVFYAGISLVRPDFRRHGVYPAMMKGLGERVAAARGVVAFDVCEFNDEGHGLPRATDRLLNRVAPFQVRAVDVQRYYVAQHLGEAAGRVVHEEERGA